MEARFLARRQTSALAVVYRLTDQGSHVGPSTFMVSIESATITAAGSCAGALGMIDMSIAQMS
jgi:hypothetical protein